MEREEDAQNVNFATNRGNIYQMNNLQVLHKSKFNFSEKTSGGMLNLLFLPKVSFILDGALYVSLNSKSLKFNLAEESPVLPHQPK